MDSLNALKGLFRRYSDIARPLADLTKKEKGIAPWNQDCDESFIILKDALTTAPILIVPDWGK